MNLEMKLLSSTLGVNELIMSRKILIADDDKINRMVLESMLSESGYDILFAKNGQQAIDLYKSEKPNIILMDVIMPIIDGYEATRKIKELAEDDVVPIIFITSVTNENDLAKCVTSGGDDFLTKPFSKVILLSKIQAMERISKLYHTVMEQRDEIEHHNEQFRHEQEAAERIFKRIVHKGNLDHQSIRYMLSPMSIFNGDLLLACETPDRGMNILLGDATGHGLPAAIGTFPMADLFYDMSYEGRPIIDIITTLNEKLYSALPPEYFVCTCILRISPDRKSIDIWNGGLPKVLIYSANAEAINVTVESGSLPLGIVSNKQIDIEVISVPVESGDQLYVYSDGIIEAENAEGDLFGSERLLEVFTHNKVHDKVFSDVKDAIARFSGDAEQSDDLTMIEITI